MRKSFSILLRLLVLRLDRHFVSFHQADVRSVEEGKSLSVFQMRPNEGETAAAADYVERMQLDLTAFFSPYSIMLMLFGIIQPPASVVRTRSGTSDRSAVSTNFTR